MSNVNNTKELRNYEQRQHKPVWRVNTVDGVPSDFGDVVLTDDGLVSSYSSSVSFIGFRRVEYGDYVEAYQTSRTKAAKYENVECKSCFGEGCQLGSDIESGGIVRCGATCPYCNGKGHTLERTK